jgi:pregnancy-associated plasma protein-A
VKHRLAIAVFLVALTGLIVVNAVYAAGPLGGAPKGAMQARSCATPEPTRHDMEQVGLALRRHADEFGTLAVGGQIKVAFHVIYSGSNGNIPQSQIDAQIAELNKAYSGFYGGANTGYTFVLASVDRRNSSKWFRMTPGTNAERQAKQTLAIDIPHRLNIYTCAPGQGLLGWSYLPNSFPEGDWHHGVVIHYGSVPGGYLVPFDLGGTADHEVGHYLGLYHTFQNGCNAPGDQVADTPDEATATSGCPGGKDTCPSAGLDPIHNYMDYSDDACYTEFTTGQDGRMDSMVPTYKPSLLNAAIAPAASAPAVAPASGQPSLRSGAAVEFRGAIPNPSTGSPSLGFYLSSSQHVTLRVYDLAGRVVATLVDGAVGPGEHSVTFRAPHGGGGVYFAQLQAGNLRLGKRLIVIE